MVSRRLPEETVLANQIDEMEGRIEALGLPKGTSFRGYVVHLPESEQYLSHVEERGPNQTNRMFVRTPDQAQIHADPDAARDAAADCRSAGHEAEAWQLFSDGKRFYAAPMPLNGVAPGHSL